jgi:hypothetical protein
MTETALLLACDPQARTEAEHMRLEVRRLESSLDRKEVQLMELQVNRQHIPGSNALLQSMSFAH